MMLTDPPIEGRQGLGRRDFLKRSAAAAVALSTGPRPQPPTVDASRVNAILADFRRFGGTGDGGTTRLAYSDEDLAGRDYAAGLMRRAGLEVSTDLAGNLIGRRPGTDPAALPIITGSHMDSVPSGGSYDGQVGSAAAFEVALTLADHDIALRHPLEVIIFQNEEGGKTGSRALVGRVYPFELDIVTASGHSIRDGIARLGGDPARLAEARRDPGSMAGFLELHIEQGALLEAGGIEIGVVEGIVGIRRWNVTVRGAQNHAGTTPMPLRRDALVAAADFVRAANEVATTMPGRQVATVGRIEAVPGAPNVVPGEVRATLEIRDLAMTKIDRVFAEIEARARAIEAGREVTVAFEQFYESLAAPTDSRFRDIVEASAAALGYSRTRMPSGAGHDAQSMAELGPVGMIFVPSRGGISHSPDEYTAPGDIARGANVLLRSVLALDGGG
ncbi:MAG: Zn-dependent hydrolase [Gemmatimonadetes bacterium]|nr:Zn-dependent hydrolase [Gemmatimonadota bacterium]MYD13322.1 Zn-dependent hydrolase [Gemmatimonadota bacterium]MYI66157.1 Zn-dependent hydrolase [Gemmatimonadota bacterium]